MFNILNNILKGDNVMGRKTLSKTAKVFIAKIQICKIDRLGPHKTVKGFDFAQVAQICRASKGSRPEQCTKARSL